MSNAGVASRNLTLMPRYRENTRTYKDKKLQRLEQVRKNLNIMFIEPDETLSDKGPAMTSFQSTSETVTAENNMEMTGPINNDQQQQNYSEALLDVRPHIRIRTCTSI
ncbi:unnamed protein product [Parnassius apollo]|uniref:(apollo) hypothetical protein n=1 Tax=Parnassius apollo TaxID=110799 RepID=A0A8S3XW10_PARAO|nr:unnamed protein product [Parnassius apollo]